MNTNLTIVDFESRGVFTLSSSDSEYSDKFIQALVDYQIYDYGKYVILVNGQEWDRGNILVPGIDAFINGCVNEAEKIRKRNLEEERKKMQEEFVSAKKRREYQRFLDLKKEFDLSPDDDGNNVA
jgi:hypothetical protein